MFFERLYLLCENKGIKPNTVAKAIGVSTAIATKWKNGTIPNQRRNSKQKSPTTSTVPLITFWAGRIIRNRIKIK